MHLCLYFPSAVLVKEVSKFSLSVALTFYFRERFVVTVSCECL